MSSKNLSSNETVRPIQMEEKSKCFIIGIQLTVAITPIFSGHIYSQINICSEHISKYYGWSDEQKTMKFVVLSYMFVTGATIGGFCQPYFLVRGRVFSFLCYSVVTIISSILTVTIKHEAVIFISRFFQGLFHGIYSSIYSIYIREMCPPNMIGTGIALSQITYMIGMYIPSIMGLKLGSVDDENSFYYMKIILLFPAIYAFVQCLLYCTVFNMKTPKYLVSKNKIDEAKKVLNKLYKESSTLSTIQTIQDELQQVNENISYKELFRDYKKP